jgi:hypothetical protein
MSAAYVDGNGLSLSSHTREKQISHHSHVVEHLRIDYTSPPFILSRLASSRLEYVNEWPLSRFQELHKAYGPFNLRAMGEHISEKESSGWARAGAQSSDMPSRAIHAKSSTH